MDLPPFLSPGFSPSSPEPVIFQSPIFFLLFQMQTGPFQFSDHFSFLFGWTLSQALYSESYVSSWSFSLWPLDPGRASLPARALSCLEFAFSGTDAFFSFNKPELFFFLTPFVGTTTSLPFFAEKEKQILLPYMLSLKIGPCDLVQTNSWLHWHPAGNIFYDWLTMTSHYRFFEEPQRGTVRTSTYPFLCFLSLIMSIS